MTTLSFQDVEYDITLDPSTFDFEEMEAIETSLGMPWGKIESMSSGENLSMSVLRGMVWIALRRHLPELPYADTAKIKLIDLKAEAADPLGGETPSTGEVPAT
jgi:hypothetical protein